MQKRKLTQEDLDNNPELAEQGLKVGEEIEIPEANELNEETTDDGDSDDEDTGGSNPPPNKERP
jgi:hypothetical protein